jgi:hypothetical protein
MRRFRALYGTGPVHLIAVLFSFVVAAYAVSQVAQSDSRWLLLLWFLGAVAFHDLVLFPAYGLLDRLAVRRRPSSRVNYVRVPVLLSALLLAISAGMVFQLAPETYEGASGLRPDPYLERWLAITAGLFIASWLLYLVRARRR